MTKTDMGMFLIIMGVFVLIGCGTYYPDLLSPMLIFWQFVFIIAGILLVSLDRDSKRKGIIEY